MSDFRIDKITNREGSAGTQIAGISTFSGTSGMQLPSGPTEYRGGRGRGIFGGGVPVTSSIQLIEIASTGNSVSFGNYGDERWNVGAVASPTRACLAGGYAPYDTRIEYVQIMTTGDAVDFGDSTNSRRYNGGASNGHGGL